MYRVTDMISGVKYRVVSDRKSYGLYQSYQEACTRLNDLVFEASCNFSEEQFWIEEESLVECLRELDLSK